MISTIRRALMPAILGGLGICAVAQPAAAQYYPGPPQGGYYPPHGGYVPQRPPRYAPQGPYGGYGGGGYGYGGGYYQRPVVIGRVCYTSRGSCPTRPRPIESSCSCFIPGFGQKAGGVIAGGW